MKKQHYLFIAAAALGLAFTSCTEETESDAETSASVQTHCPVSGEELGSMGEPVVMMHEGKEVKLCCKECVGKFEADPDKYTAMVKSAE